MQIREEYLSWLSVCRGPGPRGTLPARQTSTAKRVAPRTGQGREAVKLTAGDLGIGNCTSRATSDDRL